jgi:hypothetical protein
VNLSLLMHLLPAGTRDQAGDWALNQGSRQTAVAGLDSGERRRIKHIQAIETGPFHMLVPAR